MRNLLGFFTLFFLLILVVPACGDPAGTGTTGGGGTGGAGGNTGSIVIGVTSDLRAGVDINRVLVTIHEGQGSSEKVVQLEAKTGGVPELKLPLELPSDALAGGTPIEVTVRAWSPGSTMTELLTRSAQTTIVAGKKLLLVLPLDSRCVAAPGSSAPTCTAPQTCAAGTCIDEHVDAGTLKPYSPDWSKVSNDPCKPTNGGAPTVIVGEGQADYLPMMDGDTAQVEAGPQGGHHIWVAVRAKNLRQSGSITSITGHFPDLNVDVGPFNVIFTMDIDEGGYCKLYGLRFQLDQDVPIDMLLGHPLDVTVTVTDPDMDIGTGKRSVVLSQTFIQ